MVGLDRVIGPESYTDRVHSAKKGFRVTARVIEQLKDVSPYALVTVVSVWGHVRRTIGISRSLGKV